MDTWRQPDSGPKEPDSVPTGTPAHNPARGVGAWALMAAGIVSAGVGLLAMILSVMLTDPEQSLGVVSAAIPWIAIVATLGAVVIGIVLLERRRGRRTVAAVVVGASAVAFVVSVASLLPLPDLAAHAYGYSCPYYTTNVTDGPGWTPSDPLPYGSTIAVSDATEDNAWTTFTVKPPIDVTAVAGKAGARPPRTGTYFAVPVIRGAADDSVMQCDDPLRAQTFWISTSGEQTADLALSLPSYPGPSQGGSRNSYGAVTYYVLFDISPDTARTGAFGLSQLPPDDNSPEVVFWGAAASPDVSTSTDVYVAEADGPGSSPGTPLAFGAAQTMQSVRTRKDALKFVVDTPVDITAAARAAGAPSPENGAYIAVPITSTEIDAPAISDENGPAYPSGSWFASDGRTLSDVSISVPDYPTLEQVDQANPDGTWSFYDIFDVPPDVIQHGRYRLELYDPSGGSQFWYWGTNG